MHRFTFIFVCSLLIIGGNCQFWSNFGVNNRSVQLIERLEQNYQQNTARDNISLNILNVIRDLQPENIVASSIQESWSQLLQTGITNNGSLCSEQYSAFLSGIRNSESWALKMLDSTSKIPSGISVGNLKDLGHYDECLSVKVAKNQELLRGRHCMYSLSVKAYNATISPTMSICLPASCDKENVFKIVQNAIDSVSSYYDFQLMLRSVTCSPVDAESWKISDIVVVSSLVLFIIFLTICTVFEIVTARYFANRINNNSLRNLTKFSLHYNAKRILNTTMPRGNLPAIQGLRFFSMCWVILGHEYALLPMGAVINMADFREWLSSWRGIYILIAPFAVDTFFVISGFLNSYVFLKEMATGRNFNIAMYYFHRYIRLTPAFAALLLFTIYVIPRIGSGPLWESTITAQKHICSKNWWPMLLYVHNFVDVDNIWCLTHTWYLAVDMQLFWISPLILYPLARKPKLGILILIGFLIVSIIVPVVMTTENQYSVVLFTYSRLRRLLEVMTKFYMVTYNRSGPWLMGIYLGYIISRKKNQLTTPFVYTGWILTIFALLFVFFTHKVFQQDDYQWNASWEIFYSGFARHIWAFAICWIIYASILDYAGILSKFLSLPVFTPFGRISYSVYLIHYMIESIRIGATRTPVYFSDLTLIHLFCGDFFVCLVGGFIFCLLFESPFLALEKIFFLQSRGINRSQVKDAIPNTEATNGVDNLGYNADKNEQCNSIECSLSVNNRLR